MTLFFGLLVSALLYSSAIADQALDQSRLGTEYTLLPIYRTEGGTNALALGIGTPAQDFNLTLSTNVEFLMVAGTTYNSASSGSFTSSAQALSYTAIYPSDPADELQLSGLLSEEDLSDERGTDQDRVVAVINTVTSMATNQTRSTAESLDQGVSGFWGLGIYNTKPSYSIIPAMLATNGDGTPATIQSFTVGLDIANYSTDLSVQAGAVHWGGAPSGHYVGDFNWLDVKNGLGGGWAFDIGQIRVGSNVVDNSSLYATIDPGFDGIYVPDADASKLMSGVPGARRDPDDPTRWIMPCNTNISMTVTIDQHEYKVAASELVKPRTLGGTSCWAGIVAWRNGSLAEQLGEVRLGTPFMSGVYAALYYTTDERHVGLAGKPNSVNNFNVTAKPPGHANKKLAGILIGCLLGALLILFLLCYGRNRNSFQSIWYRSIRRQERAQMNAIVRAATLPPPFIGGGPVPIPFHPGYAPVPTGPIPYGPMGPTPYGPPPTLGLGYGRPMGLGGYQAPPMYQQPIHTQHSQQGPQSQMPQTVQHQTNGFYSPHVPLPQTQSPPVQHPQPSQSVPQNHPHSNGEGSKGMQDLPGYHEVTAGPSHQVRQTSLPVGNGQAQNPGPPNNMGHGRAASMEVMPMGPRRMSKGHQDGKMYDEWARQQPSATQEAPMNQGVLPTSGQPQQRLSTSAPAAPGYQGRRRWYSKASRSSYASPSPSQPPGPGGMPMPGMPGMGGPGGMVGPNGMGNMGGMTAMNGMGGPGITGPMGPMGGWNGMAPQPGMSGMNGAGLGGIEGTGSPGTPSPLMNRKRSFLKGMMGSDAGGRGRFPGFAKAAERSRERERLAETGAGEWYS
ncbi:hypothetical protein M231_03442 [Tremella mesenterica]|uniref:Peptidase A1 domain-containing protein n=1 Tax=Tremella mesenterica TaxID=5217 RepID=A0A4Q1BND2_TREME|nr:hypothetical protein M231_03442 [Tremella mesenterica]